MQITEVFDGGVARVTAMGAEREVVTDLTPDVKVGDYVLVHAGFSIEVVDAEYAAETLDLIKSMADLVDDPLFDELPDDAPLVGEPLAGPPIADEPEGALAR